MKEEAAAFLLLIDESPNDADMYVSTLRNSGLAVRPTRVEDGEDMEIAMQKQRFDVVLCSDKLEYFSIKEALKLLANSSEDTPLIVVSSNVNDKTAIEAMGRGARDVVQKEHKQHLVFVVTRELEDLGVRRALSVCQQRYQEAEKRNRTLLDSSRDAIAYVHDGMHVYANTSYLRMFGYKEFDEVEGTPIMDMIGTEYHKELKTALRASNKNIDFNETIDIKGLRSDGSNFSASMEFGMARIDGEPCTQTILRDQSISKELEKKLKSLSNQDLLTGLFNRQYFIEELEIAVATKDSSDITQAVFHIEIDEFRSVIEKVGIAASDLVLADIANLLQMQISEGDILSRFGDHSFALLIDVNDMDHAIKVANEICEAVDEHLSDVSGQTISATCSIGLCEIGGKTITTQEILSGINIACEKAQSEGGNKALKYEPSDITVDHDDLDQTWLEKLNDALENDRFRLLYQPIVSLTGKTEENYQALLRMSDDDGNDILPGEFLGAAGKLNLLPKIDRWVLEHALQTMADQHRQGKNTGFFIKISAASVNDDGLLPWLAEHLKSAKLGGKRITLEISETDALENIKKTATFIKASKALGCRVAMAHFGSNPQPFKQLKHLEVEYIKFDRTLMHQLASNAENQQMLKDFNKQAHELGKITIAEYVESAESLTTLWQSGVDFIQGYFLQEPSENLNFDFQESA